MKIHSMNEQSFNALDKGIQCVVCGDPIPTEDKDNDVCDDCTRSNNPIKYCSTD